MLMDWSDTGKLTSVSVDPSDPKLTLANLSIQMMSGFLVPLIDTDFCHSIGFMTRLSFNTYLNVVQCLCISSVFSMDLNVHNRGHKISIFLPRQPSLGSST